jgi:hypothetical protein
MILKTTCMVLALLGMFLTASAQSPCDNPYPDSCHVPDTCCAVEWDRCPWQWGAIDIAYMANYFRGGPQMAGLFSKYDVNCNCRVNGVDIIYLANYLKGHGPEPKCCFYQCGSHPLLGGVGDRVWFDFNRDGIQEPNPRENGIAGIPIELIRQTEPYTILRDTTNSEGFYEFVNVPSATYQLRFWMTDEFIITAKDQGTNDSLDSDVNPETGYTDSFFIAPGQIDNTWDMGLYFPLYHGGLGDFVWNDLDRDGIQDPGEPGIPNILVKLYNCDSLLIDSTRTDSLGNYIFAYLGIFSGYLHFVLPDGYRFSPQDQGTNDSLDSDANLATGNTICQEIEEGEPDLTWDAGIYRMQSVSGCVRWRFYWINHSGHGNQPDSVSSLLPIWLGLPDSAKSINVTTADSAHTILSYHICNDPLNGFNRLYAQLLTAKLNIANGASDTLVAPVIETVDNYLAHHNWQDWDNIHWEERITLAIYSNQLFDFNIGQLGSPRCDDDLFKDATE